ncbi:MAG: sigma-54 dependent transcriptional regulator [Polyangiaceae bacterium]
MSSPRLLIVDDDFELAMTLGAELAHAGYQCELASSGGDALAQLDGNPFSAIVTDWRMGGFGGRELVGAFAAAQPTVPVIVMTGSPQNLAAEAIDSGAFHYLTKPFDIEQLKGLIAQAIGDRHADRTEDSSHHSSARNRLLPLGDSSTELLRKVERLASADAPVLIRGESGSGKELVARAIHERSSRAMYPFVAVNVAAIPEHLLESEIFGHVRGAFSGATQSRAGLVAKANRGTLLLDEIGEMPLGLQAKLLRVLQSGETRPVGSDQSSAVDVRFLAATHRDLPALVKAGGFRGDLYYRLHVLELTVPALRERRPEIPGLVAHFIAAARTRNPNSIVRSISAEAMRVLVELPWAGNVRELASVLERLVVMGNTPVIEEADLSVAGLSVDHRQTLINAQTCIVSDAQESPVTLDTLSRKYVAWVLDHTKGDKRETARILGINLSTLYRWLKVECTDD